MCPSPTTKLCKEAEYYTSLANIPQLFLQHRLYTVILAVLNKARLTCPRRLHNTEKHSVICMWEKAMKKPYVISEKMYAISYNLVRYSFPLISQFCVSIK